MDEIPAAAVARVADASIAAGSRVYDEPGITTDLPFRVNL